MSQVQILKMYVTRYSKSTESHCKYQEWDSYPSSVRIANDQEQGCFHAKTFRNKHMKTLQKFVYIFSNELKMPLQTTSGSLV